MTELGLDEEPLFDVYFDELDDDFEISELGLELNIKMLETS